MRRASSLPCRSLIAVAAFLLASSWAGGAELPVVRRSPRGEAVLSSGGVTVARIDYGRPAIKGRPIFGGLVPLGEIWRLGDDEATRLTTEIPLTLGGVALEPGEYALFAAPSAENWQLIINRAARQWGAYNYDRHLDAGRAPLQVHSTEKPIENLSIVWEPTEEGTARLWFGWEKTVLSVDVSWAVAAPASVASPAAQ